MFKCRQPLATPRASRCCPRSLSTIDIWRSRPTLPPRPFAYLDASGSCVHNPTPPSPDTPPQITAYKANFIGTCMQYAQGARIAAPTSQIALISDPAPYLAQVIWDHCTTNLSRGPTILRSTQAAAITLITTTPALGTRNRMSDMNCDSLTRAWSLISIITNSQFQIGRWN